MTGRYPTMSRSDGDFELIRATAESPDTWFQAIARLHIGEIRHGLLPLFGPRFLARVYSELARADDAVVWVAVQGGSPKAFIAGAFDERWLGRLLRRRGFALLALGLPRLRPATVRKSLSIIGYQRRRDRGARQAVPAELLAIAVGPEAQRKGLGSRLTALFEDELRNRRIARYKVTTNAAERDSNAFYRAQGFDHVGTMPHHDLTLNVYEKALTS